MTVDWTIWESKIKQYLLSISKHSVGVIIGPRSTPEGEHNPDSDKSPTVSTDAVDILGMESLDKVGGTDKPLVLWEAVVVQHWQGRPLDEFLRQPRIKQRGNVCKCNGGHQG